MKKKLIITGAVIVVLIIVYFVFFNGKKNDYTFRFDAVSKGNIVVYVTATGTVNPVTSVDVGTQVSGIVSKLYADFNSVVKAGQLVAQIDPTFLNQAVKDAQAILDKSRADYNQNKRIYDREKTLYDKNLESQTNYEAALANLESSKALLDQAEAGLEKAKLNLNYATIYAPINGVVINRQVNIGQTVAASLSSPTLFTIANDLKKMQVQATVDETDIGVISVGQTATFTVDAYPNQTFKGVVSQIRLSPQIVQNVVNYTVIIDVSNDDLKLMPGMTANVKVLVAQKDSVLNVSNLALRFQPPQELIDTTKLTQLREFMRSRGKGDGNNSGQQNKFIQGNTSNNSLDTGPVRINSGIDANRIKTIRDSIVSANGGKIEKDELFAEMKKVFSKMSNTKPQQQKQNIRRQNTSGAGNNYIIVSAYPQYEKSSDNPAVQTGRGRIWVLNSKGKLEPVFVRTGLNDGRSTEIIGGSIHNGDKIVLSAVPVSDNTSMQPAASPLSGNNSGSPRGIGR